MTVSRVLITGAGGFLGGSIARVCRAEWPDAEIFGIDLREGTDSVQRSCDLADAGAAAAIVREFQPDVLFHMAGATAGTDWHALWNANVLTLANVLDAIRDRQPECRVVVPGSAAEYGEWGPDEGPLDEGHELRPSSPYGVSKVWQSVLAHSYAVRGSQVIVGRLFNLSGRGVPQQYVLGAVAAQLREIGTGERAPVISLGDISAVRDFVDVDDACDALLTLALHGTPGGVYNVCSGLPCSVGDAVDDLVRLSGTGARVEAMSREADRGGISWSVGSNAKIADETGWRPGTSFELSLKRMLA